MWRINNGTSYNSFFYWTPAEFYSDTAASDPADTSGAVVGVLDKNGIVRKVRASGHQIIMSGIPSIRTKLRNIRQRYPIHPLAGDKDVGLASARALKHMFTTKQSEVLLQSELNIPSSTLPFWINPSTTARHFHRMNVVGINIDRWVSNTTTLVTTEQENGHTHRLKILRTLDKSSGEYTYQLIDCDGFGPTCADGHSKICLTDDLC